MPAGTRPGTSSAGSGVGWTETGLARVELVRAGEEGLAGAIAALAGVIRRRRTPPTRAAAEHGVLGSVYFRITTLMHQYRQAASSNHSANVNTHPHPHPHT